MWGFLRYLHRHDELRCACCDRAVRQYLPLPDIYLEMLKKAGAAPWKSEMLNEAAYLCPYCGAADRERAYALWMKRNLPQGRIDILDIAPAKPLAAFIKREFPDALYRSGDLLMPDVDIRLDITDMYQVEDESVDFFICSHVLEHVGDDLQAMRELKRILKPRGCGIVVVPLDLNQQETDEDVSCQDVMERWRRFGQDDHIRKYAKVDFLSRLRSAGLVIREYDAAYFGRSACLANALTATSVVYIAARQ